MNAVVRSLVLAGFASFLATVLAAGELRIAWDLVRDPAAIVVAEPMLRGRYNELFQPSGGLPERTAALIMRHQPATGASWLVARLLYLGKPWSRRDGDRDSIAPQVWQDRCTAVEAAILRELRYVEAPALAEVYERYLASPRPAALVQSALINLLGCERTQAHRVAGRLALASDPQALPGAGEERIRVLATQMLVENWGIHDALAGAALAAAFTTGGGAERIAAVALLPPRTLPGLLEGAASILARAQADGGLGALDQVALVLICARLAGVADPGLAGELADLAVRGPRLLATSAATTLASGPLPVAVPVETLAARIPGVGDPVLRQALLALLMRLKPELVPGVAGPASPWSLLAEHRLRLARWEWEGMVK